jgi:hypothetical protein
LLASAVLPQCSRFSLALGLCLWPVFAKVNIHLLSALAEIRRFALACVTDLSPGAVFHPCILSFYLLNFHPPHLYLFAWGYSLEVIYLADWKHEELLSLFSQCLSVLWYK